MNHHLMRSTWALAALTALVTTTAIASEPKTREQVKAELSEAIRTGEMLERGGRSRKLNEIYPGRYQAKPPALKKSRAQVQADLAEAIRTGDMQGPGDTSLRLNELYPGHYVAQPADD